MENINLICRFFSSRRCSTSKINSRKQFCSTFHEIESTYIKKHNIAQKNRWAQQKHIFSTRNNISNVCANLYSINKKIVY